MISYCQLVVSILAVTALALFLIVVFLGRSLHKLKAGEVKNLVATNLELAAISDEYSRALEAKSNFLAVMSHELRTPLTAVMGYLEIVIMGVHGEVSPPVMQDLDRALKSSNHLLILITDILDFVKLENSTITVKSTVVSLSNCVTQVLDSAQPLLQAKNHRYEVEGSVESLLVTGDPARLQQILLNLVSNAIKFTPRGGFIKVRLSQEGREAVVEVEDNGIGISPAELETIFEPFIQLDTGMTRTVSGTGLGLTISLELARRMGGNLVCESVKGVGSVFRLTLPALVLLD